MSMDENPEIEERIQNEIVVDCYDSEEVAMGWYYYLDDHIGFPFMATCFKELDISPLKKGEKVPVTGMSDINYCTSTMLVQIKWQDRSFSVPLSQLESDEKNDNEDTLEAMEDWAALPQRLILNRIRKAFRVSAIFNSREVIRINNSVRPQCLLPKRKPLPMT